MYFYNIKLLGLDRTNSRLLRHFKRKNVTQHLSRVRNLKLSNVTLSLR